MRKKQKVLMIFIIILYCFVFSSGCQNPPDHCSNWWYYWKDGTVVNDMDKVKYLWDPGTKAGVSSPHKSTTIVGVSDLALNNVSSNLSVPHKDFPAKTVQIEAIRDGGIDGVSDTIAHEFKHIWVYQQWGAKIGQTGTIGGNVHSDGDAIPDSVETDTTPGSIGATYLFDPDYADTYLLQDVDPGWAVYEHLGDNEILARVEGINNPRSNSPYSDWSKGGKQWHH